MWSVSSYRIFGAHGMTFVISTVLDVTKQEQEEEEEESFRGEAPFIQNHNDSAH